MVLTTPVGMMADVVEVGADSLKPKIIMTKIENIKKSMVASLAPVVAATDATFLGSHPMAGSEQTGFSHSRAGLPRRGRSFASASRGGKGEVTS